MTKVDFYILPSDSIEQRHLFACRLAEKAYKLGHPIYIHSSDEVQAKSLDDMLWSWRSSSFIPHQLEVANNDALQLSETAESVQIGYGQALGSAHSHNGLMINLSQSVPEFFSRFERVSEIVVQDASITEASRASFRFYRDRGYQLDTHDLRK